MRKLFILEVEELEQLVGRDLTAWKTGRPDRPTRENGGRPATLAQDEP